MEKRELFFDGHDGKTQIAAYFYPPKGEAKAILQICHGMCEYIGRYDGFAEYMSAHGFAVCGNDHLGHGKSVADAASYGFFDEQDGREHLICDAHTMSELAKSEYPGVPLFLLGHSMGSAVARCYTSRYGAELAGAIYSGTPVQQMTGISRAMINALVKKHGPRAVSELLVKMSLGSYNKRIRDAKTPNDWLTHDEAIVAKYNADPWCTFRFTTSAYRDLLGLVSEAMSKDWPAAIPKELPVLVVSGAEDPCGAYGKGVARLFSYMEKRGMEDATLILYPGMRHEILNETGREAPMRDILAWCEARI